VPSTPAPPPGPDSRRSRFAEKLLPGGTEPDPRFTLANERTFLAWIRTSLALSAGGVALQAISLPVTPGLRTASALILVTLGVLAPVMAWFRWAALERGRRLARPLPAPLLGPVLAVGITLASLLLLVGLAVG
jgi:putative membrane protein